MIVKFRIGLFTKDPDGLVSAAERRLAEQSLMQLAEALTAADTLYRLQNPGTPSAYQSAVKYERENREEDWKGTRVLLAEGVGDCEDLAADTAAYYRTKGIKARPVLVWTHLPTGWIYHVVVWRNSLTGKDGRSYLPPGRKPTTSAKTIRGEEVLLEVDKGPTLWVAKHPFPKGYIEDPSRVLGMS